MDELGHPGQHVGVHGGQHAVAEVEDVARRMAPLLDDLPHAALEGVPRREEQGGVEVAPRNLIRFEVGEKVNVTDGPFEGFSGMVEEVDDVSNRIKVTVSIFGRPTPVELEFTQVSKTS